MKRIYYILFLATALISCEKPISEFQSKNFIKFFGSGYESRGNDVIELSGGGYLLAGYDKLNGTDQQIFVAKVDENGNLIWSKTYGNSDNWEEGKIVKEVSDGFLIAGISKTNSGAGIIHSFIMKTSFDGDSLWYKEFGDPTYNIVVNDIAVNDNNIFVTGQSNKLDANITEFYSAKLDNSGTRVWEFSNFPKTNSFFKRIFIQGDDNLLLIGYYGVSKVISIVSVLQSNGNAITTENTTVLDESIGDAYFADDQLYLLKNTQSGSCLTKLNAGFGQVWLSETFNSVLGRSIAYNDDGTLMVCGDIDEGGLSKIKFIKVNADGTVYMNVDYFKTFLGTARKIIQTKDKGLILVGSTNATYGINVQLIKTDKDYFMLKNN